jgi:nitroreductase
VVAAAAVPSVHQDIDLVLSTTRSVRLRMDLERPVAREVVERCIELAVQAPNGANRQDWRFVAIDAPSTRAAIGALYQECFRAHYGPCPPATVRTGNMSSVVAASAHHLADHLGAVPVIVVPYRRAPCPSARAAQASFWASILPAMWSFMLAARSRALVTSYVARVLDREEELAGLLGIDYERETIAGLVAVAHPDRQEFRPARRPPVADVIRWNPSPGAAA